MTHCDMSDLLKPETSMGELLEAYPGARRALFRNFHIGGCAQCGFNDDETIEAVCLRNDQADLDEVFCAIQKAHEEDERLLLEPTTLRKWMDSGKAHQLIDTRSREEHEAVKIEGSIFLTQEWSSEVIAAVKETSDQQEERVPLVFYDHRGRYVLDTASYFIGHGVLEVFALNGGIDRWAREIDPSMRRYRLE